MDHARRVLLMSTNYPPQVGGVEQVVSHLARYLVAHGDEVTVVTSRAGSRCWGRACDDGVEVHRLFLGVPGAGTRATILFPFLAPLTLVYLVGLVLRTRPELIHLHFADNATAYALALGALFRLPLVVSLHGGDVNRLPDDRPVFKYLLRRALATATVVTGPSAALLRTARAAASRVVPNGVLVSRFEIEAAPSDPPYLVTVARLVAEKGVATVLYAFAQLLPRHGDLRLIVAGDGPERPTLEALSAELGVAARVLFVGRVEPDAVPKLLAGSRLAVIGSRQEAFGIVVLETLAAGKPLVATDVGGIPEIIEDGVHGLLVPPDQPELMAAAITRLLDDQRLAARLGTQGQERVRVEFTLERQGERFQGLYKDVLGMKTT